MIDTEALRNKVIDLALQGKLTQQLPEDGNAEELFAQIKKESIKAGKIKQAKPIPEIKADEIPFKIPSNWKWVRLNDLYEINPRVEAESDADAAFIPMEKISAGFSKAYSYETQKWEVASKNHMKFQNGDVAFAKISPCFENRKSFIAQNLPGGVGGGTTELIILRQTYILPDYTYYVITDQRFISAGSLSYKGIVGQQRVKPENIRSYLVALPPLDEQKRIVSIIDTAFAQIDIIDRLQQQYESDREVLKGKIIDAGIRGKLTEQLPEDGNAEELYAQIQKEKAKLIKEGKIKKEKSLPEISDDEIPFEIPDNWKWVYMGNIFNHNTGKALNSADNEGKQLQYITTSNVYWDHFELDNLKEMYFKESEIEKCTIQKGDLLICEGGDIGRSAIWNYDYEMRIQNHIHRLRGYGAIDHKFYFYVMRNYKENGMIDGCGIGLQGFSSKRVHNLVVPLPPLKEQNRIVLIIDSILNQLDT